MGLLDIKFGDLELRPSDTEQRIGLAGAVALVAGVVTGSRKLTVLGALAIAGVGYAVYEEAHTFTAPELMNGAFQTGGALSATRGPEQATVLADLNRRKGRYRK